MSNRFRSWEVGQDWLLPASLEDYVPAGHAAHVIRDLVREELDLSAIFASYEGDRGYPPYHPAMMVALLLYGYSRGMYSSRQLARACEERLDVMAVTALNRPDFRTISEFRRRHLEALGLLFVQVLRLCRAAGLVRLGHVALDGSKVRANASKHKAMSYGRMGATEERLRAEVAAWFAEADVADAAEDGTHGAARRGDEMPAWVKDKQRRAERIRAAKAALEAEAKAAADAKAAAQEKAKAAEPPRYRGGRKPKTPPGVPAETAQRNFTDPESRIMKDKDGFVQAYNAQAAVDATAQVIVAHDLSNNAADAPALAPMLARMQANLGCQPDELSADAGYCSEANLAALAAHKVAPYIATGRAKRPDGGEAKRHGPLVERMRAKLRSDGRDSPYRLRKQTVEPVFGQIKQARRFRQFLLRGLAKVKAEWAIICTVHNLNKLTKARAAAAA